MRTVRTVRRAARRAARASPGRRADRARADDGRVPRGSPVADPPGAGGLRRRRRVAVRQPDAVQRRRATSTPTRATRPATPRWRPSSASTTCSRPAPLEVYPDGFATTVSVVGADRDARGRAPRARPLRRRHDGRHQAVQHGRAGRRLLRAEGRPAGGRDQAHGRATSTSRCGSRSARPCASRTGSRCRAATSACRPTSARAPTALHRALDAIARRGRGGRARPCGGDRRAGAPSCELARSSPSTSSSSSAETLASGRAHRRRRARRRRGARRRHPADRQPTDPPALDRPMGSAASLCFGRREARTNGRR